MPNATLDPQDERERLNKAEGNPQAAKTPAELLERIPTMSDDDPRGVYDRAGNAPEKNSSAAKNAKAPDAQDLNDAEQAGGESQTTNAADDGQVESFYRPGGGGIKSRVFLFNKRRAAFGGGILGTLVGLIMFFSFMAGPFEIVHIAQLLENAHFSHQVNAGDDRMGRMFRYLRTGDIGETRLTWLESKYKNRIISQMKGIGLDPQFDPVTKYLKSFNIDASDPKSPYHGMNNEEIQETLNDKFGAKVSVNQINGLKGKFNVKAQGFFSDPKTNRLMAKETGNSAVMTYIRGRVLGKYGLATWHPLKILDKKLNQKVADAYKAWDKARQERLKNGANASEINATNASEEDEKGKKTPVIGEDTTLTSEKVTSTLKAISTSKSLKVTGGVATAVGLVCAVNTVREKMGDIRYAQVVAPMIRMAMDVITEGSQVQSGMDVDSTTVGFVAKSFSSTDSNGKTTSWNQAKPFQARAGENGGIDIDSGAKDIVEGSIPSWIAWTADKPVPQLCSSMGQAITGTVSVVVGVFSGGLLQFAGQTVGSALFFPQVIDKLSNLLAGQAVNVAAAGAQWGNYIDYGARMASNSMNFAFGGVALNDSQVAQLDTQENSIEQEDWNSQSVADRLFNPYDDRSAVSKLIDNASPSVTQNVSKLGSMLFSFGHMFSAIPSLFNMKAAAAPLPYDYGFPEVGFSQADLDNPAVANPYANADAVAKMLDSSCLNSDKTVNSSCPIIKQANACFGVSLTKGSEGWDAVPSHSVNPYGDQYKGANCGDTSLDWLKVRFFVFDTGEMEGYACYQGDDTSCANDGMDGTTDSSSPVASSTSSTVDLTSLYSDSTSVACAPGTKDIGTQEGYYQGSGVGIRICAIPGLPSSGEESNGGFGVSGANGLAVVNSRVSGAVLAMVQAAAKDGVSLASNSTFRTMTHQQALCAANSLCASGDFTRVAKPGTSNHQMGLAIDFSTLPSTPGPVPGNPVWDWLSKNAANFGYKNYPAEAWHWSPTGN